MLCYLKVHPTYKLNIYMDNLIVIVWTSRMCSNYIPNSLSGMVVRPPPKKKTRDQ